MLRIPLLASGLGLLALFPSGKGVGTGTPLRPLPERTPAEAPAAAPVRFEPNRGQAPGAFPFLARAGNLTARFSGAAAVLDLRGPGGAREVVRMAFAGAAGAAVAAEGVALASRSHYYRGSDPAGWVTGVPHFASLRVRGLRPGVDLRWTGAPGGRLRYDLLFAPGADRETLAPESLAMEFEGIRALEVDARGDLRVETPGGVLVHRRPVAWQAAGGRRVPVSARFRVLGERAAGLALGAVDPALPLVVDPTLEYYSYLGGGGDDQGIAVAATASGALVVAGKTSATDFPTVDPVQATKVPGIDGFGTPTTDVFVTLFNDEGTDLVWSTYLGSAGNDLPGGIAVDGSGAVVVVGEAPGTNFPVSGAIQGTRSGGIDAFVTKLLPGGTLAWSTYHGGSGDDAARGVAVDGSGAVFAAGSTASGNFPTKDAVQGTYGGSGDAWVTKFAGDGSAILWSSYHGGSGADAARGLALEPDGNPTYAGATASSNFPVTTGVLQGTGSGDQDAFVARMKSDGTARLWSTYLGGPSGADTAHAVAVASDGSTWVVGETTSASFPLESPWQATLKGGPGDGFVARVRPDATGLYFSTYFGGGSPDQAYGVALDAAGTAYIAGSTASDNYYTEKPLQETFGGGNSDAFLARFHTSGLPLLMSTFLGGASDDAAFGVALDGGGAVALAGYSTGSTLATEGAYAGSAAGGLDGTVARVRLDPPSAPTFFTAILTGEDEVTVGWTDTSLGLASHEVERRVGPGPFVKIADAPRGTRTVVDGGLAEETTFTYRARAVDYPGPSAWTPEVAVTTPPTPPLAPSDLVAQALSGGGVRLTWTDHSYNETEYLVYRGVDGAVPSLLTQLPAGAVQHDDATARPDRGFRYLVRAGNAAGTSPDSNDAVAETPGTLDVGIAKGKLTDSLAPGKDSLKVAGVLSPAFGVTPVPLDPATEGFELYLEGRGIPPLVRIASGDPAWKVKNGKYKWKSAKGELPKVSVVLDANRRTFSVAVKKLDLVPAPTNPVFVGVDVGESDAGSFDVSWTTKKAGKYKFP